MAATGKRILFFASSAPEYPGDSTSSFILRMAEDVAALGYQVDLLVPHAPGIATHEQMGRVQVIRFRYAWPQRLECLCAGGSAMVQLRRNPLKWLLLPCLLCAQILALVRLLKTNRYHAIHAHWLLPQGLLAVLIGRLFAVPVITMVHGGDIFSLRHPLLQWLKKQTIRGSRILIANSQYTRSRLDAIFPHSHCPVIPTGTTPPDASAHVALDRADFAKADEKLIVFLGRLVEEKGALHAMEALTFLPSDIRAKLLIIGDGPEREALESHCRARGLSDQVRFIGKIPHEAIYSYLMMGDAFVAPSATMQSGWVEAQGNSIVEAMFAGLPVVASHIGGIPDAVQHETTGLLVPEKQPQAIAEALTRLFADPALAQRLAHAAKEHAAHSFDRYQTARRFAELYERL